MKYQNVGEKSKDWKVSGFKEVDNEMIYSSTQNVKPIIEFAKNMRDLQKGSQNKHEKMNDMHMAMRIPTTLIDKLIYEKKLSPEYMRNKDEKAKLYAIIQRDYPEFCTTNRKVLKC